MFRSFGVFNYRVWFAGALVSNIGGWMQSTALAWVVLTGLTDNDASAMGLTMGLQFGPPLLLVPITGWVADRVDRRKLLMLTQTLLGILGAVMGVLLLTDNMALWGMYCFAFGLGIVQAFDNPVRQAFVTDIVSLDNAANAVALNSASFNAARMLGPAVAGIMIVAIGSGWVFLVNTLTFLTMIGALLLIRTDEIAPRPKLKQASRLADGFRYVAKRGDLIVTFAMVFLISAFGMNFPIFASTMALEFGREADGFGLLSSILAIGSLTGALLAARRARAMIRVVILGTLAFAATTAISAFMPEYWLYAGTLMFVGFSVVTIMTTANGYVQTTTAPELRGRVLALYMAIVMGATPVGAPITGWVAAQYGPRTAILLGACAGLVAFIIGVTWMIASGRVHRNPERRFALTLDHTTPISVIEQLAPEDFSDEVAAATTPIRMPHRDD